MPGWRERRRRAEEATIPIHALQEHGKKVEASIVSLKKRFPNWADLDDVRSKLKELERECRRLAFSLIERGEEPAFDCGAEAESSLAHNSARSAGGSESKPANARTDVKTRIGRNIEKLRKECGWSLDTLAEKTGIDKKAILTHVHGKSKPNPSTQKEYAQAFTRELNRQITANNLEE